MSLKVSPRWTEREALRRGERAMFLADGEDAGVIQPRLSRPAADFRADLDAFVEAPADAVADLEEQKRATHGKADSAKRGQRLVMRARRAARLRASKDGALRAALGTGDFLSPVQVDRVLVRLDTIVELAGPAGDGLVRIGFLPADVQSAADLAQELRDDRITQRARMNERLGGTDQRNALHLRVEALVAEVAAAGMTVFREDAVRYPRYAELVATPPAPPLPASTDPPSGGTALLPPGQS
jgi:hypothetical protein